MTTYQDLKANRDAKLAEAGLAPGIDDRLRRITERASTLLARIAQSAINQALHAELVNVPCGIQTAQEAEETALTSGLVSAIGHYLQWDIYAALDFAADLLEDVNAHGEAAQVRAMLEKLQEAA